MPLDDRARSELLRGARALALGIALGGILLALARRRGPMP
jgi:hypothetical protein